MNKKILIIGNSIENTIGANITIPITNNVHFNISIKSIVSPLSNIVHIYLFFCFCINFSTYKRHDNRQSFNHKNNT